MWQRGDLISTQRDNAVRIGGASLITFGISRPYPRVQQAPFILQKFTIFQRAGAELLNPFSTVVFTRVSARTRTFRYIRLSPADVVVASKHN